MQEVNLKKNIIFNLFYFHFCFWPQVCIRNYSFRVCGFVFASCCQKHHFTSHTHHNLASHTQHTATLHTQLLSSHHSPATRHTVMNRETPTFVQFCSSIPTCIAVSSMFFTMGNPEFLHGISLLLQGKSN